MATASNKTPPQLSKFKSYGDWVRLVRIWTKFTDLAAEKQDPALVMSLTGKALETILELDDKDISNKDGVVMIINKLDGLFKKDELNEKFEDLERFETYKRPPETSIQQFLVEFDQRCTRLKKHNTSVTDDLLGFKLLKSANLASQDEQLVRATIDTINYDNIKKKIKAIFAQDVATPKSPDIATNIKMESTLLAKEEYSENESDDTENEDFEEPVATLYTQERRSFYKPKQQRFNTNRLNPNRNGSNFKQYDSKNTTNYQERNGSKFSRGKNPKRNGQRTRCNICQSINHWADQSPDKDTDRLACMVHEVVLNSSEETVLQTLLSETWVSVILDSGASSTVCGKTWFDEFFKSLKPTDQSNIIFSECSKPFRFGDGIQYKSSESATIPAIIGNQVVNIKTHIIDSDIPLLLSKASMKKAKI